jgi:hypothetical protein
MSNRNEELVKFNMQGISKSECQDLQAKSVNFKVLEEEWYYYELGDGSIFKVKYILEKLFEDEEGKLSPSGHTKCEVKTAPEKKNVVRFDLGPVKFVDPHQSQPGKSSYVLENGETNTAA